MGTLIGPHSICPSEHLLGEEYSEGQHSSLNISKNNIEGIKRVKLSVKDLDMVKYYVVGSYICQFIRWKIKDLDLTALDFSIPKPQDRM